MARWLGPLAAIAVALLFFGLAAEGLARLYFSARLSYDVEMWRYARELKTVGLTPGLRFEHRPNRSERLMGVAVATNADGLRDRAFSQRPAADVYRVAVVGDSVTFGWGVPQEQTYPKQLEAELNRLRPLGAERTFEVLNFGVGNYNIADAAAMLEHKILAFQPDMVVYGAFVNDGELPAGVEASWVLKHSLFAVWVWGRVDALLRQLGWREGFQAYYLGLYGQGGAGRTLVQDQLERMNARCRAAGIPLFVALLPELHEDSDQIFVPIHRLFKEVSAHAGVPFIDLGEALSGSRRRFWVADDDAHPDAAACSLFGAALARAIARELRTTEPVGGRIPE